MARLAPPAWGDAPSAARWAGWPGRLADFMLSKAVIREVGREDLDEWAALSNQIRAWPTSRDHILFEDAVRPAGEPCLRLGAWSAESGLCGMAECVLSSDGEYLVDEVWAYVGVAPGHRRQGLGGRLSERLTEFCLGVGRQWALVDVLDGDLEAAQPLLQRCGFVELERDETSVQDPSAVDLSALDTHRRNLASRGVQTSAFSEIDSDASREELFRTLVEVQRDMPTEHHHDALTFTDFLKQWFERPGSSTAGMFVARDGSRIVGLTYTVFRPDGEGEVFDTGVLRSHRRRGIARALKMMATRYAREQGMARVHTDSNSVNAAMLNLNRELGFRSGPVVITLRAKVAPGTARRVEA